MRRITDILEIEDLQDNRPEAISIPENWRAGTYRYHKQGSDHSLAGYFGSVVNHHRSILGNRPAEICIQGKNRGGMTFSFAGRTAQADLSHSSEGFLGGIRVGEVDGVEHVLALKTGLGLNVDFNPDQDSFPAPPNGLEPFLNQMEDLITPIGDSSFSTVRYPVASKFGNEGYAIFLPARDSKHPNLVIDHQSDAPSGPQRVRLRITPDVFAFIASAREVFYEREFSENVLQKLKAKTALKILKAIKKATGTDKLPGAARILNSLGICRETVIPGIGLGMANLVVVDSQGVVNPKEKFNYVDKTGKTANIEHLMHEIIDILGALALLKGRFAGEVITYKANLGNIVEALKAISKDVDHNIGEVLMAS